MIQMLSAISDILYDSKMVSGFSVLFEAINKVKI